MARSKMSSTPIVFLGVLSFTIFNIMRSMNYPNHIENILPATDITVQIKEKASPGLSPFFSVKPLTKSLHPNWKLFNEMSENQQDEAIDAVGVYLTKYAKVMGLGKNTKHGECVFDANIGRTGHTICGPPPPQPCAVIGFGVFYDPSFDRDIANAWKCRGFAGDPTVRYPSKLHDNVTFHNIGATMLQDNDERLGNKGGKSDWLMTSVPKLRYFLGLENIAVLKMDCEGCEMALSRDMLREDPSFLHHVDQISIETHVSKSWITTREQVYYFGLLFVLLEEAGFKMEWSSVFGCKMVHEITGCVPELEKYGWPCGYDPWPGKRHVVRGRSCQEFTWKRYPINEE